jgi:hypothetical protein
MQFFFVFLSNINVKFVLKINTMKKLIMSSLLVLVLGTIGFTQGIKYTKNDTIRYIVKNDVLRFFGGTFWTGAEFPINNRKSILVNGIVTYGSTSSNKENIGYGAELQYRSYLGKGSFQTNYPIYLASQFMFRRINSYEEIPYGGDIDPISGIAADKKTQSSFNVYYFGLLLGCQVFVNQIFTVDLNFGGGLRLSQVDGEKSFTRYKGITDLDYSGVIPRFGLTIGIIQH